MKTVRNLLYRDVLWSVFFVTIFFIALFFFIDFVDEMSRVGRNGYTMGAAALATLLAFISYYNVLNLSRAWVASGKVSIVVALVGVHGLAFLVAIGLLWWRDHATVIHPLRLLTRRSAR